MIFEYPPMTDRCKKKGLQGVKRYYYIFFASTHPSAQGQGLCPKLIRYWQDVATRDKVPLWLEATTEKSMRVYTRCGFEIVELMFLGKGRVGKDGMLPKKGDGKDELGGVPLWGMVWWPAGVKPAA
jgi:ribosomal protein S18 acetylase RimI-like enzyme